MKSIAFNTIVLITASRFWRADVATPGGEVQGLWSSSRRASGPLGEAVRNALALGGTSGRSVLVLSTDLWMQSLTLHPGQVAGLSEAEIARALAFEVEPFSGIPTVDSVVGSADSGMRDGTAGFWVTQLRHSDRDAIQQAAKDSGCKLAGIGHPGGVPMPLGTRKTNEAWRRVEVWDGCLLMVACEDGRQVQSRVISAFPDARQMPSHGSFETLHALATPPRPMQDDSIAWQQIELADERSLRAWLGAWALSLQRSAAHLPLIAPVAAPPSSSRHIIMAGVLMGLVVMACITQMVWYGSTRRSLSNARDEHARTRQLIEGTNKQNAALQKELEEAHKQEQLRGRVEMQRRALPLLLSELAARRTQDIVVRSIKPEQSTMIVGGLALDAASVDELGIILTQFLRPVGLVAQPLEKKARRALANDGPWDFTLSIKPVELTTKTLPAQAAVTE